MFSIYYHKQFFTFSRFADEKKESTNSRILSILSLMNLSERKLTAEEEVEECLSKTINWDDVQDRLNSFRKASLEWLKKSLHEGKVIE